MTDFSNKATELIELCSLSNTKLGDLRKQAKEIKKDHNLALELWSSTGFMARQLAILIMDKKLLTKEVIDQLTSDIESHEESEQTQLMDWLMANQLTKDKKLIELIVSWEKSTFPLQRRIFWYYQGRLRWMGKTDFENTKSLLDKIDAGIRDEVSMVQWAMNFTACWIGVFDTKYRNQCNKLGEKHGLYKDEMVAKNCTPNYLPEFIKIEAGKRNL